MNERQKFEEQLTAAGFLEPAHNVVLDEQGYRSACDSYRNRFSTSELWDFIRDYAKENQKTLITKNWDKLKKHLVKKSVVSLNNTFIARMKLRNIKLPKNYETQFTTALDTIVEYVENTNLDDIGYRINKPVPLFNQVLAEVQDMVEMVYNDKKPNINHTNIGLWLNSFKTDPNAKTIAFDVLNKIAEYSNKEIGNIQQELEYYNRNKTDVKLSYSVQTLENVIEYHKHIIEACASITNNHMIVQINNHMNPKKVAEKISKSYLQSHKGLKSIEPEKIVGKKQLITYDVNSRIMKIYNAMPDQTLTFHGCSVKNVDMNNSFEKKVGDIEEIKSWVKMYRQDMMKAYKAVNNTEYKLKSDYINGNSLFLKYY